MSLPYKGWLCGSAARIFFAPEVTGSPTGISPRHKRAKLPTAPIARGGLLRLWCDNGGDQQHDRAPWDWNRLIPGRQLLTGRGFRYYLGKSARKKSFPLEHSRFRLLSTRRRFTGWEFIVHFTGNLGGAIFCTGAGPAGISGLVLSSCLRP